MKGDRFRLMGSHEKGLKSMSRGWGGSARTGAWAARAARAASASSERRVMAGACGRGDGAIGTARALILRRHRRSPTSARPTRCICSDHCTYYLYLTVTV